MAVKKFVNIKNVGRLVNCAQKGTELLKYNLIFGENGRGKTTLCAIFRSLQTGQIEYIMERKTISPTAGNPSVEIRLDKTNARFSTTSWNTQIPEIAIFDSTFVANNVHSGEYVDKEHRSNLLKIIIGEEGVSFAKEIESLDNAIREKNNEIRAIKQSIQTVLPQPDLFDNFLSIKEDALIADKIKEEEKKLLATQRSADISTRNKLSEISLPQIPHELFAILKKTLADVSADADKKLKSHIAFHQLGNEGEKWISKGLAHIRDDKCPFCEQNIKELSLVESYKQFFSTEYHDHKELIESQSIELDHRMGEKVISKISNDFMNNETLIEFWKQFFEITPHASKTTETIANTIRQLQESLSKLIALKISNPLEEIVANENTRAAQTEYEKVCKEIEEYNVNIQAINSLIQSQKDQIEKSDIISVQNNLEQLKLIKLRYEDKIDLKCEEYLKANREKEQLSKDKDERKRKLDEHSDEMIADYENTINELLKGFGAGFTITNSKKVYRGGTPSSTFQVLINNQPIDLGDISTPIGQACFRTTLSSGDKNTLALAFFLAKISHDKYKQNLILVFDDPFSSQDRSRRERTAELLKLYGQMSHQLILLSHDPSFLNLFYSKLPTMERRTLQLSRIADNNSSIEDWDIEKETQEGYFRDHAALSSYSLNGARELIDIVRKIRPVLEGYLRYRFPNFYLDNEWLGDMIKRIRDSGESHPLFSTLDELGEINDFSKKYHHDTNPGKADNEAINDGELKTYVQRTLFIVGGY